jgi:hypothetical protein
MVGAARQSFIAENGLLVDSFMSDAFVTATTSLRETV